MGLDADVIVIGPKDILHKTDVLDYPITYYDETAPDDVMVISTLAIADTTDQSYTLASVCGVDAWDLEAHRVRIPVDPYSEPANFLDHEHIGSQHVRTVYFKLKELVKHNDVQVWYRPNG
jgi:hypothetical protein